MKIKRQKHSFLFKGMVLVIAFALTVLCFPVNGLVTLASVENAGTTDHNYITLGKDGESISKVVKRGNNYIIPDAYIGGNHTLVVGDETIKNTTLESATLLDSDVTVRYGSSDNKETVSKSQDEATGKLKFEATNAGTYVITYSYRYRDSEGKEYTNKFDLQIESVLAGGSVNFENNQKDVIPDVIDLSLAKVQDSYKNLYIPVPTVKDENGEELENLKVVTSLPEGKEGNYVVISANGGVNSSKVTLSQDETDANRYFISGDTFKDVAFGAGKYTITYKYYSEGEFITSTTKSTTVYAEAKDSDSKNYYQNYKLKLQLASDFPTSAQTGVEATLPAATGVTSDDTTPAKSSVAVYYKVKVRYMSKSSDRAYSDLKKELYNADSENLVLDEDGYLIEPTKFKPLEDGWYTFIYEITDFYGKTVKSDETVYEWTNIKDEQKPVAVVYDASVKETVEGKDVPTYEEASHKLASNVNPNAVVIYAVGLTDNVSKMGDENIQLSRKIMTDETVEKLIIDHYDEYNLVFNYRETTNKAYTNLLTNNYLIEKAVAKSGATISSDKAMLNWLKDNGFLIAIDNGNLNYIFENIFEKDAEVFGQTFENSDKLKTWLVEQSKTAEGRKAIADLGFAYFDCKETFGQSRSEATTGMGLGQYYIHYIAIDAAGNKSDVSRAMYVGTYVDSTAPEIKFPTTLSTTYYPDSTITFDSPSATDNNGDKNMLVRTAYRYLNKEGKVVPVNDEEGNPIEENKLINLGELFEDMDARHITANGKNQTENYKDYTFSTKNSDGKYEQTEKDGYVELTDKNKSSYSLKLKDVDESAVKLQIIVFTYDDAGNANIYGETIDILRTIDNKVPTFVESIIDDYSDEYVQGTEIKLPSLKVRDDAVDNMTFDVVVRHTDDAGNVYYIDVEGGYGRPNKTGTTGWGSYTVEGGTFVASFAGEYQAIITIKDSNNNAVTYFKNYDVEERASYWQDPVMNVSMENKTVELDDAQTVVIPTPTISYSIPNSVTYDVYSASTDKDTEFKDTKYVLIGVDKNKKATTMGGSYVTNGSFGQKIALDKIKNYEFKFVVNMTAYNHKNFTYVEGNETEEGGYFLYKAGSIKGKLFAVSKTEFRYFAVGDDVNYSSITYKDGDISNGGNAAFTDEIIKQLFEDIKFYPMPVETFTIEVKDTKGPVIAAYDYESTMSAEELKAAHEDKGILIKAIQATDKSGIDWSKSKVTVTWKPVDTKNGAEGRTDEFKGQNDEYFNGFGTVMDGTIKIVYTVYDNAGSSPSTAEYNIVIGDNEPPRISTDKDFISDKYEIGTELKIDLTKIFVTDNKDLPEKVEKTVTLKDTNGKEVEIKSQTTDMLIYALDNVGTYTLTVETADAVGNKTTQSYSFEVTEKAQNTVMTYQIIGTVLIVVSVLVLAGVIIYFIVSKVKLDKELKK